MAADEKTTTPEAASVSEDTSPLTAPAAAEHPKAPKPNTISPAELGQLVADNDPPAGKASLDMIIDIEVPISVELGRTEMSIGEVLELGPGSIVELRKMASDPVDLLVNNKLIARGEVVIVDENFGIRITSIVDPRERLKNAE
ncbi:MAG TPA: flagellar motor switch protein FliN [Planctomycetota bacterium]|nr:flagellar motor switch protein FliN [Planctomycetota bacterium]HUW30885.1 flagellar motor switch protein FliN [Planctomycetota bacterium]